LDTSNAPTPANFCQQGWWLVSRPRRAWPRVRRGIWRRGWWSPAHHGSGCHGAFWFRHGECLRWGTGELPTVAPRRAAEGRAGV